MHPDVAYGQRANGGAFMYFGHMSCFSLLFDLFFYRFRRDLGSRSHRPMEQTSRSEDGLWCYSIRTVYVCYAEKLVYYSMLHVFSEEHFYKSAA